MINSSPISSNVRAEYATITSATTTNLNYDRDVSNILLIVSNNTNNKSFTVTISGTGLNKDYEIVPGPTSSDPDIQLLMNATIAGTYGSRLYLIKIPISNGDGTLSVTTSGGTGERNTGVILMY